MKTLRLAPGKTKGDRRHCRSFSFFNGPWITRRRDSYVSEIDRKFRQLLTVTLKQKKWKRSFVSYCIGVLLLGKADVKL